MAAKKPSPVFDFVLSALEKDPNVAFATVRDAAAKKGITLYPIVYGRAKAVLGLVPMRKRGEGPAAKKAVRKKAAQPTRAPKQSRKGSTNGIAGDLVSSVENLQRDRDEFRTALAQVREILSNVL